MKYQSFLIVFLLMLGFSIPTTSVFANEIPRFASLSSDKVYLRAGPGKQYPVKWIYKREGYPIEIVREFDHWRKIRDRDGHTGWVYKGLLTSKRTVIVSMPGLEQTSLWLKRNDDPEAQKIARVESGAILFLKECNQGWCRGSAQGITGWIERKYLWGIYETEIIE